MRKLIIVLILAGLLTLATAVPAFADIPPGDAGGEAACVNDFDDGNHVVPGRDAEGNTCGRE